MPSREAVAEGNETDHRPGFLAIHAANRPLEIHYQAVHAVRTCRFRQALRYTPPDTPEDARYDVFTPVRDFFSRTRLSSQKRLDIIHESRVSGR